MSAERVATERVRELLAQATPGPWTHERVGWGLHEVTMDHRRGVHVEGEAEAALIAAAPDLAADLVDARTRVEMLRGHLSTLLSYEQSTGHAHEWGGHWDSSGGRVVGGLPCLRCHQFADAREAVGLPRWPALPERDEEEATEHRDDCGCGGWRAWR